MKPASASPPIRAADIARIAFDDRPSSLPLIDRVWRSHSEQAGSFHSMAACHWGIVVSRVAGETRLTVRGPETRATLADCPADGEWVGITFRPGSFLLPLPATLLRDRNDVALPALSAHSFLLDGSAWEYPGYENAETFVRQLLAKGLIAVDRCVQDLLEDGDAPLSKRSTQRRVLRTTGLTTVLHRQIGQARHAVSLLRSGRAIVEVAVEAGYFDQAHLTRALRRFVGQTPRQVARNEQQLSLLYKTDDT